ncbi:PREDICTED: E3 ubiquitin-protein ligase RFWD3 [Ipomoea nil]|uniref:E3 ubiquitin-protein ligase RFWD3 n=1 Tax=Ipomoea nil TaxID=35883 RepID=UPI000901AB47|nr:PREDICTED: E3 ubiquitin-protein ligase RFWD3 [Ipomoea nil]
MPRRLVGFDPAFIAGFDDIYEEDERFLYHDEEDDDDEEEEEEEEEDSEEETDGGEEEEQDTSRLMPRRVLQGDGGATTSSQEAVVNVQGSESIMETMAEDGGAQGAKPVEKLAVINSEVVDGSGGGGEEWSRSDIDGLFCPICMEAWSNGGNHQICCLPCGHIYGISCIKKWLQQRKSSGKCPQCNKKCTMKDVRLLYASQLHVVDEELQKKIQSLEAQCASLEKKCSDLCKKEVEWERKEANLQLQVRELKERRTNSDYLPRDKQSRPSELYTSGHSCNYAWRGYFNGFSLKEEMRIEGARFFDVDVSGQILIIARRLPGMGGIHVLTKMSLLSHHEKEDIQLPLNIKAIKDLHISPYDRLVLVASLGKKLSVLSTESNNTVLTYDLPAAAWSCSWDVNNSYYVYAGLQNGMVMEFDRRQTVKPVESMNGLAAKPIHTVHSVLSNPVTGSGLRRSILTASSVGLCHWNFGCSEERPHLIPESEDQGVCISLAYASRTNDIVASFRPKVEMPGDFAATQTMLSPSASPMEQAVQGSHVVYRVAGSGYHKVGSSCANVSGIRFPKSTIIERDGTKPIFAYGDEASSELVLQELPSLKDVMRLQAPRNPIRDVKYTHALNSGLLSCLRQDTMQLFTVNGS